MAFQVGAFCYQSAAEALSAIASDQVGAVVQHGGAAYVVGVTGVTGSSITYSLDPVGGGSPIASTVSLTPQPCQLLDWADGLTIGWGIAAAWIATAVVMSIRNAAHS